MKIVFTSLFSLLLLGLVYAQDEGTHMAGRENKAAAPPMYANIGDNDKAMDKAVEHAQSSLGFFIAAFRGNKSDDSGFEIKKAFMDGDNVEHLWIGDLTFDGKNFHGEINNQPVDVHNVRLGQRVTVRPDDVTDWMFVKNGKLMGGYTTRVLYARLSPQEKAQFDKEAEFKIE